MTDPLGAVGVRVAAGTDLTAVIRAVDAVLAVADLPAGLPAAAVAQLVNTSTAHAAAQAAVSVQTQLASTEAVQRMIEQADATVREAMRASTALPLSRLAQEFGGTQAFARVVHQSLAPGTAAGTADGRSG